MPVSRDDVLHVARLARLSLSEEEIARLTVELGAILDHIDMLNDIDTSDVAPLAQPGDEANVLRDDVPAPCLSRDDALRGAPSVLESYFSVPKVVGGD